MNNNYKSGRAIALMFSLFFLLASVYATVDRISFMKNSVVTDGSVIGIVQKSTSKLDRTFIFVTRKIEVSVISYKAFDGQIYRIEENPYFSKAPYKMGEKVKVRYDKEFPSEGIVDNFTNLFGFVLMFYFVSFVFLFVYVYMKVMTY